MGECVRLPTNLRANAKGGSSIEGVLHAHLQNWASNFVGLENEIVPRVLQLEICLENLDAVVATLDGQFPEAVREQVKLLQGKLSSARTELERKLDDLLVLVAGLRAGLVEEPSKQSNGPLGIEELQEQRNAVEWDA
jgi:hypothetical protein